jgi:hypothetical protein
MEKVIPPPLTPPSSYLLPKLSDSEPVMLVIADEGWNRARLRLVCILATRRADPLYKGTIQIDLSKDR